MKSYFQKKGSSSNLKGETAVTPDEAVLEDLKADESAIPDKAVSGDAKPEVSNDAKSETATPDAEVSEGAKTSNPEKTVETVFSNDSIFKSDEVKEKVIGYVDEMAKTKKEEEKSDSEKAVDDVIETIKEQVNNHFDVDASSTKQNDSVVVGEEESTVKLAEETDTESKTEPETSKVAPTEEDKKRLKKMVVFFEDTVNDMQDEKSSKLDDLAAFLQGMVNDLYSLIKASEANEVKKSRSAKDGRSQVVLCGVF